MPSKPFYMFMWAIWTQIHVLSKGIYQYDQINSKFCGQCPKRWNYKQLVYSKREELYPKRQNYLKKIYHLFFNKKLKFFKVGTIYFRKINIFITGKIKKIDVTFKCPFNYVMSGNSGSETTHRILEFLQLKDVIFSKNIHKVYYFFSMWQNRNYQP